MCGHSERNMYHDVQGRETALTHSFLLLPAVKTSPISVDSKTRGLDFTDEWRFAVDYGHVQLVTPAAPE